MTDICASVGCYRVLGMGNGLSGRCTPCQDEARARWRAITKDAGTGDGGAGGALTIDAGAGGYSNGDNDQQVPNDKPTNLNELTAAIEGTSPPAPAPVPDVPGPAHYRNEAGQPVEDDWCDDEDWPDR